MVNVKRKICKRCLCIKGIIALKLSEMDEQVYLFACAKGYCFLWVGD